MAKRDQLTKRRGRVANNVSHSKRRTKTKKELNLHEKRFKLKGNTVKLRISTKTLKEIRKNGVEVTLKKYKFVKG